MTPKLLLAFGVLLMFPALALAEPIMVFECPNAGCTNVWAQNHTVSVIDDSYSLVYGPFGWAPMYEQGGYLTKREWRVVATGLALDTSRFYEFETKMNLPWHNPDTLIAGVQTGELAVTRREYLARPGLRPGWLVAYDKG